jgi:hypothetical protein
MELTPEQEAAMKLYKDKQSELTAVMAILFSEGLKVNKSLLDGEKNCDYFRGVNFHIRALGHYKAI